jgi:methanogenic corrinoid protein MtbC1
MARFEIGAVVQLTGLSGHVIRAWERRHGAVKPDRGRAGKRRYSAADVERLKLLHDGVEAGHRIGAIANLSDEEIRALLPKPVRPHAPGAVDDMLSAIRQLDGPELEHLLTREALALGPLEFCRLAVSQLLDRIGDGWAQAELCVAEEHMATAAIKGVLTSLLRFGSDRVGGEVMVFATLPRERHELGALMAAICAQNAGARTLYLGPDLPIAEIVTAARRSTAKVVALSAAMPATEEETNHLSELINELPRGVGIWIGGRGWSNMEAPSGVRSIGTLEALRQSVFRQPMKA